MLKKKYYAIFGSEQNNAFRTETQLFLFIFAIQ